MSPYITPTEKAKYEKAAKSGCEECGRRVRYVYFWEGAVIAAVCGYHRLRKKK